MQKRLPGIREGHSQQQPTDSVYVSSQIKQMDVLLDENLTSQMNTTKIVEQLSIDIVHMQKDMNDMQQFLSSLVENQEAVRNAYTCLCNYKTFGEVQEYLIVRINMHMKDTAFNFYMP